MADLVDAMYVGLTGQPTDAGLTFGDLLNRLVESTGSVKGTAGTLGVSTTTVSRWRRGVQRPKTGANVIRGALRRYLLKPGLERDIRNKTKTMRITGIVHVSKEARQRTINVGRYFPKQTITKIINTWLKGDDDKTSRMVWNAIDKYYLNDVDIDQITSVEFKSGA